MEDNHAPGAGYSALLPPVMLFAAATSSVWVFQINDQQVKWTPPIQNVYRSVTDGRPTIQQERYVLGPATGGGQDGWGR